MAIHAVRGGGPDDLLVQEVYFVVSSTPRVTATLAETVDDDANGQIDAYKVTFSSAIDDVSLSTSGFAVGGSTVGLVVSTSLPNHSGTADSEILYLSFPESGVFDTANTPELTYSFSSGTIRDVGGLPLHEITGPALAEQDKAPPAIVDADASNASGGAGGIESGDDVQIVFSENTNTPIIDATNINTVLLISSPPFSQSHTWGDSLISANWLAASVLKIVLKTGDGGPEPNLEVGVSNITTRDTTTPAIQDALGNKSTGFALLDGNFGVGGGDISPPVIGSRETQDQNLDGFIDAIKLTFTEPILDSSMTASIAAGLWGVSGATGLNFDTGVTSSDTIVFIKFTDGVLDTAQTPNVSYNKGTAPDNVVDLASPGNELISNAALAEDKARPVLLSATASDNNSLAPDIDGDDTVVLRFNEATIRPTIDSNNINDVLVLTPSTHTWGDVLTTWNTASTITIRFNCPTEVCNATLVDGDTITVSGSILLDLAVTGGNSATGTVTLGGSFAGVDTTSPTISTLFPADGAVGVVASTHVVTTFSERLSQTEAQQSISLTAIRNNMGQALNTAVSATVVYSTSAQTLTLTPDSDLTAGYTYQVGITTQAIDRFNNPLASSGTFKFTTLMDSTQENKVLDSNGALLVSIPAGTFGQTVSVEVNENAATSPVHTPISVLQSAKSKFDKDKPSSFDQLLESTAREITVKDASGNLLTGLLSQSAEVTLSYTDAVTVGIVDGTSPPVREETLKVYSLDDANALWVRLTDSSVDTAANTVTGKTQHFSIFALAGTSDVNLAANAFAFPVPFRPSRGDNEITFSGLSAQATIEIFTLAGKKVKTIQHTSGNNQFPWDVKNDKGSNVASGVYHYVIKNASSMKKGKLVIIR